MKKTVLTVFIALLAITFCQAQRIEMQKVSGGYKYVQNGNQLKMRDLVKTMETNQQAFSLSGNPFWGYPVMSEFDNYFFPGSSKPNWHNYDLTGQNVTLGNIVRQFSKYH